MARPRPAAEREAERAAPWRVLTTRVFDSGTRYELSARATGHDGAGTVTVKHRTGKGAPFVCLTCDVNANACEHVVFVQAYIASVGGVEAAEEKAVEQRAW